MKRPTNGTARRWGRAASGLGLSVALACTMALPQAIAAPSETTHLAGVAQLGVQQDDVQAQDAISWSAPTSALALDAAVLTAGAHGSATAMPDMLGINATVIPSAQVSAGDLAQAQRSDRLGVYGSDANENPNPYLYNEFYNRYAETNNLQASGDTAVWDTVGRIPSSFNEIPVTAFGYPADLALRPDLVIGTNTSVGNVYQVTMNHDTTTSINYATWGVGRTIPTQPYQYVLDIRRHTDKEDLLGTKNSDGNVYERSEFYRSGDEGFDPIAVTYDRGDTSNTTGLDCLVENVDELTWRAQLALANDATRTTRYGSVADIAIKYEQFVKATKWYILKKIDEGKIARKKVAVVTKVTKQADSATGKVSYLFGVAKFNPDGDASTLGNLRVLEAVQDTTDDVVSAYFPDAKAGTQRSSNSLTAQQLMDAGVDAIICMPSLSAAASYGTADVEEALSAAGYAPQTPGYPQIFDAKVPLGTFESLTGYNTSVEAAILVGVIQGFLYPEVVNPIDMMAYYSSSLFHLKDAYVEPFVKSQLADVSLPAGVDLSTARCDAASVKSVQALLDEGTAYYYEHKDAIDQQRPRIASSDMMDDAYGVCVTMAKVNAPTGATVTVVDEHGLPVVPDSAGRYAIDDADASTLTVSLDGYRDYTMQLTGGDVQGGTVTVSTQDMLAARTVSFDLPQGAQVQWVKNHVGTFVRAGLNGSYVLDIDDVATYSIRWDGYEDREGTIELNETTVRLSEADFELKKTATKINVPVGATLGVCDPQGKSVTPDAQGLYGLSRGITYTLTVEHPNYETYTTTVVGGENDTVSIRLGSMTEREAQTELTLNAANITASSIGTVNAPIVQKITLGPAVKTVAANAFVNCPSLQNVEFGANVQSVGASAFKGLKKLATVTFNSKLTSIGASAFEGCTALKKISIPASVKTLGASAFSGCSKLASAGVGKGVTALGKNTFKNCTSLASVTLGSGLKSIGASAFEGCAKLTRVTIPAKVTSIGAKAFSGCKKLKTVSLGRKVVTIDKQAFLNCKALASLTLPANVSTIKAQAFKGCSKLKTLTVKTKKLKKAKVKSSLSGSKVKTLVVKVGSLKDNKKYVTSYKKIFTKANCGLKVTVRR